MLFLHTKVDLVPADIMLHGFVVVKVRTKEYSSFDWVILFALLDEWLMFDDENVTPVTEEDVLKLSGGGDWHTAYLLIYGPRTIEYEEKSNDGASGEANATAMDTSTSANGAKT